MAVKLKERKKKLALAAGATYGDYNSPKALMDAASKYFRGAREAGKMAKAGEQSIRHSEKLLQQGKAMQARHARIFAERSKLPAAKIAASGVKVGTGIGLGLVGAAGAAGAYAQLTGHARKQ